jgi:Beta-propeller repeat
MLAWLVLAFAAALPRAWATAPAPDPLARLPLCFEANQGQAASAAQYLAHSRSGTVLLSPASATVVLTTAQAPAPGSRTRLADRLRDRQVQSHTISLEFLGANSRALMTGLDTLSGKANYFLGSDPTQWRTNLTLFERVRVAEAYPGVDLVFYGSEQKLEYDLVVAPGADPGAVRLRITGADRLELDAQGDLVLSIGPARLRQHKPICHQVIGGVRRPLTGGYRLIDPHTVAFEVGRYDARAPLIIDPVLTYASYLGGALADVAYGTAVDAAGNVYVTGQTLSLSLPTTPNVVQRSFGGGNVGTGGDAFVAKFNGTDSSLIYLTYLGGSGNDIAVGIAVDAAGDAYLTGATDSPNFPRANAIQPIIAGVASPEFGTWPYDAFVTKLNPSGSALIYSTYLGGDIDDEGIAIALDSTNNVYVTGMTDSDNFKTFKPLQGFRAGSYDAFVTKLNSTGTSFLYSTYLGGAGDDEGQGIAVDALGRAFITGVTLSGNFPTTNAVQPWLGGGQDAFVTVMAPDGQSLVTSTYLGGTANDTGKGIALDAAGSAYVVGIESSRWDPYASFPVSPGNLNPGGVFASSDGGATWSAASVGLADPQVFALAVSPGTVYAGTGHGIARSTNAAASWAATTNAPPTPAGLAPQIATGAVGALAVDPLHPSTLYAGTSGAFYRSLDAGSSWTPSNPLIYFAGATVSAIAVDPQTTNTLYAGTPGYGVFKSINAATNWVAAGLNGSYIFALAIDPQTPTRLYAGTGLGVYRSENQGDSWTPFVSGLSNLYTPALAIDPQTPSTVYAGTASGVFKSVNLGTNWIQLPLNGGLTNLMQVQALAIDPVTPTTVYAGTTTGLFKSTDGGATWTITTNGLSVGVIHSLAVDPANPSRVYAGTAPFPLTITWDAFLTKLTDSARTIQFSTVLHAYGVNEGVAVAVDGAGNSYLTGDTTALDFPTTNTLGLLSATNHGGHDAFVTAINADASALLYSAYLGGSGDDYGYGIALDPAGNAWVVGQTYSADFPTTNAFQATSGGGSDAFVARISSVLPPPVLTATRLGTNLQLRWRATGAQFTLQRAAGLPVSPTSWTAVPQTPVTSNGWSSVTLPIEAARGLFRLHRL